MSQVDPELKVVSVILCDDIREEVGNKKSLMGVIGGDIIAAAMPAAIQLAIYIELIRTDKDKESNLDVVFFVDDNEIVKFQAKIPPTPSVHTTLVIPKGIVQFDKDGIFSIKLIPEDKTEIEALRKTVGTMQPNS